MNKKLIYTLLGTLLSLGSIVGCGKEDAPDQSKQVLPEKPFTPTIFDQWLRTNYVGAYNIDFKYRMEDIEISRHYNLVPTTLENSMKLSKIVRHAWLGVYDEVAGLAFMRSYAPRVIALIGSSGWNGDGSILLGTAEGGLKVVLYSSNHLNLEDPTFLNRNYFQTMHHEFGHILHQNKPWPVEFNEISRGDYLPSGYFNKDNLPITVYAPKGFVTAYARSKDSEDITEVTACYITFTDQQWTDLYAAAGEEGGKKIRRKVEIMKQYMKDSWGIDMDELRAVARRRSGEIASPNMVLIESEWRDLLDHSSFRSTASGSKAQPTEIDRDAIVQWLMSHHELLDMNKYPATGGSRCQIMTQICSHQH